MPSELDKVKAELFSHFDAQAAAIKQRMEEGLSFLRDRVDALEARVDRISERTNDRINDVEQDRRNMGDTLDRELRDLEGRVSRLER